MRTNPSLVKAFADSMPKAYVQGFDWTAIAEHANVAHRRQAGHCAIGSCSAPRLPGIALCVTADDRPGLLAAISAALVRERLDVIAAEAYTRRLDADSREAVDIFWVQRIDGTDPSRSLTAVELARLESTLDHLIVEQGEFGTVHIPTRPPPPPQGATETNVRFIEDRSGQLSTLEIETNDRTGMLLVLARTLFAQQVQVVSSLIRTKAGRVSDRFEITEVDGTAIKPERRLELQVAVLRAVQEAFGQ